MKYQSIKCTALLLILLHSPCQQGICSSLQSDTNFDADQKETQSIKNVDQSNKGLLENYSISELSALSAKSLQEKGDRHYFNEQYIKQLDTIKNAWLYNDAVNFSENKAVYIRQDALKAIVYYIEACERFSYGPALWSMGIYHHIGKEVTQSDEIAFNYFKRAAIQNYAPAQCALGWMYENGLGTDQNYREAFTWYKKASDKNQKQAEFNIGSLYKQGWGVEQNRRTAAVWYTKAAKQDHVEALRNLGIIYTQGLGVPKDFNNAFICFRKAANLGDRESQCNLGLIYMNGTSKVLRNYETAKKWFEKAAAQNDRDALNNLGTIHLKGLGVPKNLKKAIEWYEKAAEQDDRDAQACLSVIYEQEPGIENEEKALKWLIRACEQDHAGAQFILGSKYEKGQGVTKDINKAMSLLKKSANQGFKKAQYYLGIIYWDEEKNLRDLEKSIYWLEKGADQTNPFIQFILGSVYFEHSQHTNDPKQFERSISLLTRAAEQKNENAIELLETYKSYFNINKKQSDEIEEQVDITEYDEDLAPLFLNLEERGISRKSSQDIKNEAMFTAFEENNLHLIKPLILLNADVNAKYSGLTLLGKCASNDAYCELVQLLCDLKGDINIRSPMGMLILHSASFSRAEKNVEILCKVGANVDIIDSMSRERPLHIAAMGQSNFSIIEMLLKYKADVNSIDGFGKTPLDRTEESHMNGRSIALLREHGALYKREFLKHI